MRPLTRPVERVRTASRAAEQRQALAARQPRSQAEQVGLSRIRAGVRDQPGRNHDGAGTIHADGSTNQQQRAA